MLLDVDLIIDRIPPGIRRNMPYYERHPWHGILEDLSSLLCLGPFVPTHRHSGANAFLPTHFVHASSCLTLHVNSMKWRCLVQWAAED